MKHTTVVLLAHGSSNDAASEAATQALGRDLADQQMFAGVRVAFLDQAPSLAQACSSVSGPIVVVGLFAAEGLHGGHDVPALIAELARAQTAFAGNVGTWPEIADLVAGRVRRTAALPMRDSVPSHTRCYSACKFDPLRRGIGVQD